MSETNNNILKDVIAEMDQLVSVATANAKISLEEEFTPAIKSMLTRRLRIEADERKELPEGTIANPSDASLGVGGADFIEGATVTTEDAVEEEIVDEDVDIDEDMDLDLEAIIQELEKDLEGGDDEEDEEGEEGEEDAEGEEGAEGEESEEGEEGAEGEAGEDEIEAGEDEIEAGEEEKGENPFAKKEEDPFAKTDGDKMPALANDDLSMNAPSLESPNGVPGASRGLDLDALMAEIEEEEVASDANFHAMSAQYEAQKNELADYREAVAVLRGKIQEVNLLNGKLLFTSQLFRKDGLSAEQKIHIVEAFDRCVDIREVKLVYAALAENFKISATKKPAKQKKMVTEGIASAATGNAPEKKDAEVITENTVAKRLQFLAGIPTS